MPRKKMVKLIARRRIEAGTGKLIYPGEEFEMSADYADLYIKNGNAVEAPKPVRKRARPKKKVEQGEPNGADN